MYANVFENLYHKIVDGLERIFVNCGKYVKMIAKLLFFVLLLIAAFLLIYGILNLLMSLGGSDLDRLFNLSAGIGYIASSIAVALLSLSTFPLYAVGSLVDDIHTMRVGQEKIDSKLEKLVKNN